MSFDDPPFTCGAINFIIPPPESVHPLLNIFRPGDPGHYEKNYKNEAKEVPIENLRAREQTNAPTFDVEGFQLFTGFPAVYEAFDNDEGIKQEYYSESAELVKKLTGASQAIPFHHRKASWCLTKHV